MKVPLSESIAKIVIRFIDKGHPAYALAALALILCTVMVAGVIVYRSGAAGAAAITKQITQLR